MSNQTSQKTKNSAGGALFVAIGIFLSRISGLVRERIFAHFFGNSDYGDAFKAALKIPNFLQNLFGEGVLSASFIPVYAKLIGEGKNKEAGELASIVGTLLFLTTSILVLLGVIATPWLIDVIAPGFTGEKRDLTIQIVQILFPGTGLLVLSAWCLGVLNSHKNFFLPYVAPVLANIAMIAGLLYFGFFQDQKTLAISISYAFIAGSALQLLVQLPKALNLVGILKPQIRLNNADANSVIKNFFPVVISRGVVQVSAYIDNMIASLLPTGAVSALAYAQTLYMLPISLFGMSVSAAELPAMSQAQGSEEEIKTYLRQRLNNGLTQIAFFVIPTCAAFFALGNLIVALLFQTGAFDKDSTQFVWWVLAGSTVGLLAATQGRLYSSAFYSFKDTKTPLKIALVRVFLTTIVGSLAALYLPGWLGLEAQLGTVGLATGSALVGWLEYSLLRYQLEKRIGKTGIPAKTFWLIVAAATAAALGGLVAEQLLKSQHFAVQSFLSMGVFGVIYLLITHLAKIPQATRITSKVLGKITQRK